MFSALGEGIEPPKRQNARRGRGAEILGALCQPITAYGRRSPCASAGKQKVLARHREVRCGKLGSNSNCVFACASVGSHVRAPLTNQLQPEPVTHVPVRNVTYLLGCTPETSCAAHCKPQNLLSLFWRFGVLAVENSGSASESSSAPPGASWVGQRREPRALRGAMRERTPAGVTKRVDRRL